MELPVLLPAARERSCQVFRVGKSAFASGALYHARATRSPAISRSCLEPVVSSGSDRLRVFPYVCAPCGLCRVLGSLSG